MQNLGANSTKCPQLASKETAICTKTHCILHQNALHFASERSLFWYKTQVILHLNAVYFAVKRKVKSIKMHRKLGIMRFHFD